MAKIDFKNSNFVVEENVAIGEAMKVITANKKGAVVVVDLNNRVAGILSDGDIRRGLVKGATLMTQVQKLMNQNVKTIGKEDKEILSAPQKFFDENRHIHLLPVVDKNNKLVDILVLGILK